MLNYSTSEVHISSIKPGDTVKHEGIIKTVSKNNIKRCSFMGLTLFGDSYQLGYKPVSRVKFNTVKGAA